MRKTYNAVKNFEQDVSSSFIKGAAILTISMVIVKVFGLLNKIILVRILTNYGIEGMASFGMGLYKQLVGVGVKTHAEGSHAFDAVVG